MWWRRSSTLLVLQFNVSMGLRLPPHLSSRASSRSGLPVRRKVTVRCSGPCWSCSTSWTASAPTTISRHVLAPTHMHVPSSPICVIVRLCVCVCVCGVLQVIAATNRVDILDPALLRSGQGILLPLLYTSCIVCCAVHANTRTYVYTGFCKMVVANVI